MKLDIETMTNIGIFWILPSIHYNKPSSTLAIAWFKWIVFISKKKNG